LTETDFIAKHLDRSLVKDGHFTCRVPSNIALVKYWGKDENQIPKNASISFTLDACFTMTTLKFSKKKISSDEFDFDIFLDQKKQDDFKPKIQTFFKRIIKYVPFLSEYRFVIHTRNSFPHSSGIASSASGMAALALCIMQMEKAMNSNIDSKYFNLKTSFLSRLGSGSASRSLSGEVIVWGNHKSIKGSSDLYGIPFPFQLHHNFKNYHDTILLVDKGEKQVSSTVGHNLMQNHPFAEQRFRQANDHLEKINIILQNGDLKSFITTVESEALSLHAMMMTSHPYFILMKPNTLQIIEKIWRFRTETDSNVCFTLDAGANVHVLFPESEKEVVNNFIVKELIQHCQNNQYICDRIGFGAKVF
jgi:diphosphomevalonate decarboxylase